MDVEKRRTIGRDLGRWSTDESAWFHCCNDINGNMVLKAARKAFLDGLEESLEFIRCQVGQP